MSRQLVLFDRFLGWMNKALEFRDPGLVTELDPSFVQPGIDSIQGGFPIGTFVGVEGVLNGGAGTVIIADPNVGANPLVALDQDTAFLVLGLSVVNNTAGAITVNLRRGVALPNPAVTVPSIQGVPLIWRELAFGVGVEAGIRNDSSGVLAAQLPMYIPPSGFLIEAAASGGTWRIQGLRLPAGVSPLSFR